MSDDEPGVDDLDARTQAKLRDYVAFWRRDLLERGLLVGDRLRPDFLAALLRALRGAEPPPAAAPPLPDVPDDAVEA